MKAAPGNERGVRYPGESSDACEKRYLETGIPVVREIYDYLVSDHVHVDRYDHRKPFATQN